MRQRARSIAISAIVLVLTTVVWWVSPDPRGLAPALHHPQGYVDRVGADQAAVAVICFLCWILVAWLALGLSLTAAAALPGMLGHISAVLAGWILPATFRRAAALALGLSLATGSGVAGAMIASHSGGGHIPSGMPVAAASLDWPAASAAVPRATSDLDWPDSQANPTSSRPRMTDEVVVLRGDSLWSIAARHLGSHADAAHIAREWPRWYAANRAVIGPDPDLIRPGQRLVAPTN